MPQRYIILDTETTGLKPEEGHRVIEIAGLEMIGTVMTGQSYHIRLQPDRPIDPEAQNVHGISDQDLKGAPRFKEISDDFINFIKGSSLVIHNAPFDVGFLDSELEKAGKGFLSDHCDAVIDTLQTAREIHPGQRNTLDALCDRYEVDRSIRVKHGAMVDVELLAAVFLTMSPIHEYVKKIRTRRHYDQEPAARKSENPRTRNGLVVKPHQDEMENHAAFVEHIDKASKGKCLWKNQMDSAPGSGTENAPSL